MAGFQVNALGFVMGFLAALPASAQTRAGFEVGALAFDYANRERVDRQTVVRDDGTFVGVEGRYVHPVGDGWFLRAATNVSAGAVNYRSTSGTIDNVEQSIAQVEFHAGVDLRVGASTVATLYGGIGGRILEDESGGKTSSLGEEGYDREVRYTYLPVGVALGVRAGRRTTLNIYGQYNHLVAGKVLNKFSGVDPDLPNVDLQLRGGKGLEGGATLGIQAGRHRISVGPFVRHWNVDPSRPKRATLAGTTFEFIEPHTRITELGLALKFGF